MRYLGNKQKLLLEIQAILVGKNISGKDKIFFDAFAGTGTVGEYFKNDFKVFSNDSLFFAYCLANGKNKYSKKMFSKLGLDPFVFFNDDKNIKNINGFMYNNYCPAKTKRQYFSTENAIKIDFIRHTIEQWLSEKKINNDEYTYLIGSLLESASKVANIAGVYGAYLKIWDKRALKKMDFIPLTNIDSKNKNNLKSYNENILDLIEKVSGDIIYIDPPYTKNKYTTQYHLLETIAKNDDPIIKGITGGRDFSNHPDDFTKDIAAHIAFEKLIRKCNFKHIVVSYSSAGIMSKEYIESILKRYGNESTLTVKKIAYNKYKNHHSEEAVLFEYIFYIEKKQQYHVASPLNYIGGKADLIDFIKDSIGTVKLDKFYDLFGGGFNVGVNFDAKEIIYNELNFNVKNLIEYLINNDLYNTITHINKQIKKFKLEKNDSKAYTKFRSFYNSQVNKNLLDLYVLILYGFQQQIRFNSKMEFNNPVGESSFNLKILEKLITFVNQAKDKKVKFESKDYELFESKITNKDLVYVDPPYLITLGSYNDGKRGFKGWNEKEEERLYSFLDRLNKKGIRFVLSNVIEHKGKINNILKQWIIKNQYVKIEIKNPVKGRKEVIIKNF